MTDVVEIQTHDQGVVQITMRDTNNKNTFSEALVKGLIDAFTTVEQNADNKVVILTGYGPYFATGGTQDCLLALASGHGKFTDTNIYSLALDCPIPVISAMQGHGVGGGLVMGLFADFVILSHESIYTTNFMKYGFTPGFGATYIVPKKLGPVLGPEMLLTAQTYRGETLASRGAPFPVYKRENVLEEAFKLAETVAEKPRHALMTLKEHLVTPLRNELGAVIDKELQMHEQTFHGSDVKERIKDLF